jgi:hypothetical protein
MMRGDELKSKYSALEMVVQTGHNGIRGVNKFRDIAVYTSPSMSTVQMSENDAEAVTHLAYKDGKQMASYTSGQLVDASTKLWEQHISASTEGDDLQQSVFMAADLETPFGFASFLACASNFKKVFIPGSYKMSHMIKSVPRQHSSYLVCDEDFYTVTVPEARAAEYTEMVSGIKGALVGGSSSGAVSSSLFTEATGAKVDKYSI